MGAGTPRALDDVVAHLFFIFLQLISLSTRSPRLRARVGLHAALDTTSRSMWSTENSMAEITDLGTGASTG